VAKITSKTEKSESGNKTEPKDNTPWWKNRNAQAAMGIIGCLFIAAFILWFIYFLPYVSTDDAAIDTNVIKAANQGAGYTVTKIYVKEGDAVKKGDILLELDHRTAEAQLEKALAHASFTATDYKRAKAMESSQGISKQQFDKSGQDAIAAHADLELAQIALENTYIKSFVDGVVIQMSAVEGNILEAGQTAVTLADTDNSWITANIQEKEISAVKTGQPVYVSVDEGGSLTGKVGDVRKAAASVFAFIPADNASGNFVKVEQRIPVKIQLDPHPGKILRVGQSVEIKIKVR
jgi:membrane fusion protein (multidrug efflux system)